MTHVYKELTLNLLSDSPQAGKLLSRLYDKHKLYAVAKARDPKIRRELTNIIAELLQLNINTSKNKLIEDVLLGLLGQAETDLKRSLSERLATIDSIPEKVIEYLAKEEIIIADPVLRQSNVLQDEMLISIIHERDALHWQSIASRGSISGNVINELANTEDVETAFNLTKNKNIVLTSHAMRVFSDMAKTTEKLVKPLLGRKELPKEIKNELYSHAGEALKEEIADKIEFREATISNEIVDDLVIEFCDRPEEKISPTQQMIEEAERMQARGLLTIEVMIKSLRSDQFMRFVSMFSVYCGLPIETVTEVLCQKSGQGLSIMCKAMNFQKSDFVNIFLLTSSLRGQRIIGNEQLVKALAYYDRISEEFARKILRESRH